MYSMWKLRRKFELVVQENACAAFSCLRLQRGCKGHAWVVSIQYEGANDSPCMSWRKQVEIRGKSRLL